MQPVLDEEIVASLLALEQPGVPSLMAQLIEAFLQDGSDRLNSLGGAVVSRDSAAAHEAAHSLKSMSAAMGAVHMSALCQEFEQRAFAADVDATLAARIEAEFARVADALRSLT
ncbi:MAG TPA: Hpt domain-containing protein [Vicinamibacterales bacterium]|nr:Hpt domain-containing protein [Vicinamibacterales bacterium]